MSDCPPPSELQNWTFYYLAEAPPSGPVQRNFETNAGTAPQAFDSHPTHAHPVGTHPVHSNSFDSSISTQSTMTNSSSSSSQQTYLNVGVSPSFDLPFSEQQIPDKFYGLCDTPNVSGLIQNAQEFPTFMHETAGTNDQHALQFDYNHGVIQEWAQPYLSANVNQSPFPIDPGLTRDTIPRHPVPVVTGSSLGNVSALEAGQDSSNVHTIQPRQSSSPLLLNEFGYVEPVEAWNRCVQKPPLPTEEFAVQFFPLDDAPLRTEKEHRCQLRARVTTTGRGVWEYSKGPCNAVLKSVDSYRRHIILCHLGCHRGDHTKLVDWIVNRWIEHDRFEIQESTVGWYPNQIFFQKDRSG